MFPFKGEGSNRCQFDNKVKQVLRRAADSRSPVFLRGGRDAPSDYIYLYPKDADSEYIAILVDAKHTKQPRKSHSSVTVADQIKLLRALVSFSQACKEAGLPLARDSVKVCFLTNRSGLSLPMPGKNPAADLKRVQDQIASEGFPQAGVAVELLTKDTVEFEPFSSILFALLP